jgi:threonine synthase
MTGYSFTDQDAIHAMQSVYKNYGYLMDPHGAIAYAGLKKWLNKNNGQGIFLETAHPAKFFEVVESAIDCAVEIPERLKEYLKLEKKSTLISSSFLELKAFLLRAY